MKNIPPLSFPTFLDLYSFRNSKRKLKYVRSVCRYLFARMKGGKHPQDLVDFLNQNKLWATLFHQKNHYFHSLLYKYADKRFSMSERKNTIIFNFNEMLNILGESKAEQLVETGSLQICRMTETLSLHLDIYKNDPFEGFFALSLRQNGNVVYNAAFSFVSPDLILITCIQGPKSENSKELIKVLTKELHGMRPMYFLIDAFRLFAINFEKELVGIPMHAQTKKRWYGHKTFHFDYDLFWRENKGKQINRYWHLPLDIERKALEEIASKKRSMYRKRYAVLDELANAMLQFAKKPESE